MTRCHIAFSLLLVAMAEAFSTPNWSMQPPSTTYEPVPKTKTLPAQSQSQPQVQVDNDAAVTAIPWRIVLDIGREALGGSSMSFEWARSGCRMPMVIPCDLTSNHQLLPQKDTVSYTGPGGAVEKPIVGGSWKLSSNQKELTCDLTFPEYMERRDVWIDAGSTLSLETTVFTKQELEQLNQEFYRARDEAWKLGEELNNIQKMRDGPKKWNEVEQKWERRYDGPPVWKEMQMRMQHMGAQAKQKQASQKRPNLNDLSEMGTLPDLGLVYIQKQGVVKYNNAVIGRWLAEPILNRPVSYSSN